MTGSAGTAMDVLVSCDSLKKEGGLGEGVKDFPPIGSWGCFKVLFGRFSEVFLDPLGTLGALSGDFRRTLAALG